MHVISESRCFFGKGLPISELKSGHRDFVRGQMLFAWNWYNFDFLPGSKCIIIGRFPRFVIQKMAPYWQSNLYIPTLFRSCQENSMNWQPWCRNGWAAREYYFQINHLVLGLKTDPLESGSPSMRVKRQQRCATGFCTVISWSPVHPLPLKFRPILMHFLKY